MMRTGLAIAAVLAAVGNGSAEFSAARTDRVGAAEPALRARAQQSGATDRPVPAAQAPDLAALEAALSAAPDDLKAGNDYRMAVIQAKAYDRAIAFFQKLVTANPNAANAHLNYGFAYVDKIPAAGAITQVILANNALGEFTRSLEIRPTWIALYTRGNSYLFWPRIFNRTHLGLADLNEALKMQKADTKRSYHVRVYVALGDGYWKSDDLVAASNTWRDGLVQFPDHAALKARLSAHGDELKTLIEGGYDPAKRVDTSLRDLWTDEK
jgi:tetratricopeptide (TPR) repeat protein